MKEAKDEIDSTFRETIGTDTLQPGKKRPHHKRSRQLNQGEESEDSDSSSHDDFLEPTPLAVHDAAYADEVDDDIEELGFRIGRMRLGERIGGHYRPRIADEVSLHRGFKKLFTIANFLGSRSCHLFSISRSEALRLFP
jgi:hypothetical protein